MEQIQISLTKEHLELLIESISKKVIDGSTKELKKMFVTNEKFYYSCLAVVTFILITYAGLTWNNPKMIQNIKGEQEKSSPKVKIDNVAKNVNP